MAPEVAGDPPEDAGDVKTGVPAEGSAGEPEWARACAWSGTWRVLLPFVLALLVGLGMQIERSLGATDQIAAIAVRVGAELSAGSELPAVVEQLTDELYGSDSDPVERRTHAELVRTIGYRLRASPLVDAEAETIDETMRARSRRLLLQNRVVLVAVQALLVLLFPSLFVILFHHSATGVRRASAKAPFAFGSFTDAVWYRRNRRYLDSETHWFFWRRLGFGLLIVFGTIYLQAPAGLQASAIGEYVTLDPIPGRLSYPYWFSNFANAPPFVVGLAGFVLYSLTVFAQRFVARDLNHRLVISLFNRGITVVILSLVLSSITEGEGISRSLIFVAGIFPQTGVHALGKITQRQVDLLSNEGTAGFAAVPQISVWKATSLRELGILDVHDLACESLPFLVETSGINPHVMVRAVDRAILIDCLGIDHVKLLEKVPLYTASELVVYVRGIGSRVELWQRSFGREPRFKLGEILDATESAERKATVEEALGAVDISQQLDQLEIDRNVAFAIDNKLMYGNL